ncbi:hypothetical protein PCASD_16989 [Puccinia coronata f. sp. avenae]|uniref:Uncharacterized protein n=1 Tax=Puccinia coronata f. sp. avenae TaxID=200324 RepID=A0A2N5U308_9BASI|nr:hypothetical protein PCASD_16989 [Puccinia coronata f. sp. avenae]
MCQLKAEYISGADNLSSTHPQQNTPFNPVPPHGNYTPPPNPPNISKEQEDFEAVQFALKQAQMVSGAVSSITGTLKNQLLQPNGSN